MEKGEITGEQQESRKARKIDAVLLHCLTSILQPVWLGWPYQEYKNSSSIAIRFNVVRNPPTTKK